MRLDGRRQSTNVDDRRGMSGGAMAAGGIGLGGLLIIGVISLLMGRNPVEVVQQVGGMSGTEIVSQSGRTPTA